MKYDEEVKEKEAMQLRVQKDVPTDLVAAM